MLYIPWMVILSEYGVKHALHTLDGQVITVPTKQVWKTSIFELLRVENCISRLCTNPLGDPPPPPDLIPKKGEKHVNTA